MLTNLRCFTARTGGIVQGPSEWPEIEKVKFTKSWGHGGGHVVWVCTEALRLDYRDDGLLK